MNHHKTNILFASFYGIPPITSIRNLYEKVKDDGTTFNEVKEFVKKSRSSSNEYKTTIYINIIFQ